MIEAWSWNIGVPAVVTGTLASLPLLTSLGGLASAVALCLFPVGVHAARPAPRAAAILYRCVAAVVLVSTPIGLALAWMWHG